MIENKKGAALVIAILLLAVLAIFVPALVEWVRHDTNAGIKQKRSSTAFHLAEAGIDRARWKLLEKMDNWTVLSTGTLGGYDFDREYDDVSGGTYAIKITSSPSNEDERIVESVGRDLSANEMRKVRAVFRNTGAVDFAVRAERTITIGASVNLEWGPVMSNLSIVTGGRTYPRFYSAGHVSDQDGGVVGARTDDVQWWSYYNIPSAPRIRFSVFESSAIGSGDAPDGCGNGNDSTYKLDGNAVFKGCQDTSNKSYYITGTASFQSGGSSGNFIIGNVIVMGDLSISGNGGGSGSYDAVVPPKAWEEYGNNWAHYQAFDTGEPATYAEAVNINYSASASYHLNNVLVRGFLYTGGSQGLTGGGNAILNGILMSANYATADTSNFTIYYDDGIASNIPVSGLSISMVSWDEVTPTWPL